MIDEDIELLKKDKRIESIEREGDIVTFVTNDLYAYDRTNKILRRAKIGKLKVEVHLDRNVTKYGGPPIKVTNLTFPNDDVYMFETCYFYNYSSNEEFSLGCWGAYQLPFQQAFFNKALLELVELFFRFNDEAFVYLLHGESRFFIPGNVEELLDGEWKLWVGSNYCETVPKIPQIRGDLF